jgi:hypothetical protein
MDTRQLVNAKVQELQPLYDRMDATRDLLYQTGYRMRNFQGQKIDNVISVTMNTAARYAFNIIAELMGAKWQTTVEGELTDRRKHVIISAAGDLLVEADEQLARQGKPWLFDWLCNHVCTRSGIGARWTYRPEGDTPMCLPVDLRYTPFQYGADGLAWACNITYRNGADLNAEYAAQLKNRPASGRDIEVWDFWDARKNEIWIGGRKILEQANPFGYPPFVFAFPATGFMLRDKGYLEHECEDIFFLGKNLFDEENRSVSIAQTRAFELIAPRYEQEREDFESRPADQAPRPGQTIAVRKGETHRLLPEADVTGAYQVARGDIKNALNAVTANDIDMGNVDSASSGVLFNSQYEARAKTVNPRLRALANFYEQTAKMLLDQAVRSSGAGGSFFAGRAGGKRQYRSEQIGDPAAYTIAYTMSIRSESREAANRAQFFASKGQLPLRTRLTDVLKAEDPDGIMRELEVEEARQADPAIALFEMALRCVEQADNLEEEGDGTAADALRIQSRMLTERCAALIRQRAMETQPLPAEARVPLPDNRPGNTNLMQAVVANTKNDTAV